MHKRLDFLVIMLAVACLSLSCDRQESTVLYDGFVNPPQEARPRVWWHWMNGNVTKDGIYKDLMWMHRVGIGGVHNFDAGMVVPQVVDKRLVYMDEGWKDAFAYATHLTDSLGMEMAIASAPGWSSTGGPWVKPENAMKKLTWREFTVNGGSIDCALPEPYTTSGAFQNVPSKDGTEAFSGAETTESFYEDIAVIAVKLPEAEKTMAQMGAKITSSGGNFTLEQLSDGDLNNAVLLPADYDAYHAWIQVEFPDAQTIKALSIADGNLRNEWACEPAEVTKYLDYSNDGIVFTYLCEIPSGGAALQTIDIPETTARFFRVRFDNPKADGLYDAFYGVQPAKGTEVAELVLHNVAKINHAEEKAGFASPHDMMQNLTPNEVNVASEGDVVDISDKVQNGKLQWNAPEGNWKIYRFGYSLTGKKNHPASPEATGLEVDKLDKDAVKDYFNTYLSMYNDASNSLMGERGLQYLLIDSYEAGWETWTNKMAEEFQSRRGYSVLPWLPVLTGRIIGSNEQSEAFLKDWRKTIAELIEEMYATTEDILKKHGMKSYFESHENGRMYLADGMAVKKKADIPMAAMWALEGAGGANHTMSECDIRESAAVSHIYGKNLVALESFTSNGLDNRAYSFYPGNLKPVADLAMSCGVNRFVVHESAHQPVDDKKPGLGLLIFGQWFNRNETWAEQAKAWTDYLARSSYMLQQGQNVADILYYYGEDNCITGLFSHTLPQIPKGYNFDYLNADALLHDIKVKGGHIVAPSGVEFKVLVLDANAQNMSPEVRKKLDELKRKGVKIFDSADEAVKGIEPDFSAENLRFVHRSTDDAEIYWVSNPSKENKEIEASFRVKGLRPQIWHPETAKVDECTYYEKDGRTFVKLNLLPEDAVFVVFSGKSKKGGETVPELRYTLFRHLDTPWKAVFDGYGAPNDTVIFDALQDWSKSDNPAIKFFSGNAVYTNSILISEPELKQGKFVLNLGKVGVLAEVKVNGKDLGVVWKAPYLLDVSDALQAGENLFEIKVVNLWKNRIIGDEQPGATKYTYPAFRFFNADSPLSESGLMGPVDLLLVLEDPLPYDAVHPGQIILDTNGKPVQAHGFQILKEGDTYYWYGENKEYTTRGSHVWTWGIRCYKSQDFYNWEDCGLIIPPDTLNPLSPLHYTQSLDRPHIIKCPATGKYVCWIKSMDEDGYFVILQADSLLGPYTYVRSLKPDGYGVGDFDLYADPETGKGYVWFERPHWELICATLSNDFSDVTDEYSSHFSGLRPPYTREAPTHFVHDGKHYLFTSGTTGYYPNQSQVACFEDYHGDYQILGDPHPEDEWHHSFCSQITDVVEVNGALVAVADRWMPQIANSDVAAKEVERMVSAYANHEPFPVDFSTPKPKDKRNEVRTNWDVTYNGTYVFLPIDFSGDYPIIHWKDEWKTSEL